jgi:hypothetical protein
MLIAWHGTTCAGGPGGVTCNIVQWRVQCCFWNSINVWGATHAHECPSDYLPCAFELLSLSFFFMLMNECSGMDDFVTRCNFATQLCDTVPVSRSYAVSRSYTDGFSRSKAMPSTRGLVHDNCGKIHIPYII